MTGLSTVCDLCGAPRDQHVAHTSRLEGDSLTVTIVCPRPPTHVVEMYGEWVGYDLPHDYEVTYPPTLIVKHGDDGHMTVGYKFTVRRPVGTESLVPQRSNHENAVLEPAP